MSLSCRQDGAGCSCRMCGNGDGHGEVCPQLENVCARQQMRFWDVHLLGHMFILKLHPALRKDFRLWSRLRFHVKQQKLISSDTYGHPCRSLKDMLLLMGSLPANLLQARAAAKRND
jgi:hypothetical protein